MDYRATKMTAMIEDLAYRAAMISQANRMASYSARTNYLLVIENLSTIIKRSQDVQSYNTKPAVSRPSKYVSPKP